jgi:hypothetical protein
MTIERSTEMTYSPKTSKARRIAAAVSVLLGLPLCMTAHAQEPPKAVMETPMLDPWVPPGTIKKSTVAVPTQGASLAEQVERKLKAGFDAADVARTGTLTRAQAEAGGLGYIAKNFDAIDRNKTGSVRFEDVKAFLDERNAKPK